MLKCAVYSEVRSASWKTSEEDGEEDSEWSQHDAALEEICKVEGKKKRL